MTKAPKAPPEQRDERPAIVVASHSLSSLDDLALGEVTPPQALAVLRAGLADADPEDALDYYDAVRALAWKKFAERIFGEEMQVWYDVLRQASALFEARGMVEPAAKLAGFSELAFESIRFGRVNSVRELQGRAHVRDVLEVLHKRGGQAMRDAIMGDTKLRHANLSRVLAHMASAGFVERRQLGRKVSVSLTSLGREAIASPPNSSPNALVIYPPLNEPPAAGAPKRRRG